MLKDLTVTLTPDEQCTLTLALVQRTERIIRHYESADHEAMKRHWLYELKHLDRLTTKCQQTTQVRSALTCRDQLNLKSLLIDAR